MDVFSAQQGSVVGSLYHVINCSLKVQVTFLINWEKYQVFKTHLAPSSDHFVRSCTTELDDGSVLWTGGNLIRTSLQGVSCITLEVQRMSQNQFQASSLSPSWHQNSLGSLQKRLGYLTPFSVQYPWPCLRTEIRLMLHYPEPFFLFPLLPSFLFFCSYTFASSFFCSSLISSLPHFKTRSIIRVSPSVYFHLACKRPLHYWYALCC